VLMPAMPRAGAPAGGSPVGEQTLTSGAELPLEDAKDRWLQVPSSASSTNISSAKTK